MGQGIAGQPLDGTGLSIAVVAARWNAFVVDQLVQGAIGELQRCGVKNVFLVHAPGAFELPLVAKECAIQGNLHAIVVLGAVIRGDTPHFDFVAGECARGVAQVALERRLPVIFGVLTTNTNEQALSRAALDGDNKGAEAARTAIEMAHLLRQIRRMPDGELDKDPNSHLGAFAVHGAASDL